MLIKKDSTNVSVELYVIDSTDGTPETGVVYNSAGIDLNYRRDLAAVVSITEVTLAALTTAHTDGGVLTVANGRVRLDVPDAAFATGVSKVTIGGTITGMVVLPLTIQLVDFDPDDAVRLGLTALPNAAADAAGGLAISDAGGLDLDAQDTNINDIETAVGVAGAGLTDLGGMSTAMKAEVNAEALDVLATDTFAAASGVPSGTSSLKDKLDWCFRILRNKETQTATTATLRTAGDGGDDATATVSDDGTTATRGEWS
tara:strand:- start:20881 stop:21654 length:774 start_codon:yes stop_codon:yes gene_type:complete